MTEEGTGELGDPFIGPRGSYNFDPDPRLAAYLEQFEARGATAEDERRRQVARDRAESRKELARYKRDSVPRSQWLDYNSRNNTLVEAAWRIDKELEAELRAIGEEICQRDNAALLAPFWPHNY